MNRFIARENIRHFRDRLRSELDSLTRSRLHHLLVEEMDKLGLDLELLAEVERAIKNFSALIETQEALVAVLERDGHRDAARDRALLDGLKQTQILHKMYHNRMQADFERSHLQNQGSAAETPVRLDGLHILLVEDSWHIGEAIKRLLQSIGAEVVGPAATMAEAERLLSECIPDAAIIDLLLQQGERADGLVDRLCDLGVRVIVASGYDLHRVQREKVAAIVDKPFTDAQLLAALQPLLAQRGALIGGLPDRKSRCE